MKINLIVFCVGVLLSAHSFAGGKDYQVTGPVLEVNADSIVVQKGSGKWELAKSAATKGADVVKVGDKVTIYYSMTAQEIEVKSAKKKK